VQPLHPLHAILLGGTLPAFLGALLTDVAYYSSYEIQWKNFASWLIVGGLVFCGFALLASLVGLARRTPRRGRRGIYVILLLTTFVLGLVNAFVHAGDAWASMPAGLALSVIVAVLAVAAAVLGYSRPAAVNV
jgi:uncharacterized membrane protein